MTVLENPDALKQQITVNKNIEIPLNVYKIDYVTYGNSEYDRKTAYILSESAEAAEDLIVKSVKRGVPIQWEARAGMICSIHGTRLYYCLKVSPFSQIGNILNIQLFIFIIISIW
jgi:hypothetical protein